MKRTIWLLLLLVAVGMVNSIRKPWISNAQRPPFNVKTSAVTSLQDSKEALSAYLSSIEAKKHVFVAHGAQNTLTDRNTLNSTFSSELLAGFVVSVATIPKAIAYSSVLKVSPLTGIWTSVIVSLFTTSIGGCPGKLVLFNPSCNSLRFIL